MRIAKTTQSRGVKHGTNATDGIVEKAKRDFQSDGDFFSPAFLVIISRDFRF